MAESVPNELYSPKGLKSLFKLAASALDRQEKTDLLTTAIMLNKRVRRWPKNEIDRILEARAAGLTDDEIRALVRRLHADRARRAAELRGTA